MLGQMHKRTILEVVLWKIMPLSFLALLSIWLTVSIGGGHVLSQQNLQSLKSSAEQQNWAVTRNIANLAEGLENIAGNALIVNAFIDPLGVQYFLQPYLQSIKLSDFSAPEIIMTDFSGQVLASSMSRSTVPDLPAPSIWLKPAIAGDPVLAFLGDQLVMALPVWVSSVPEGVLFARLSKEDTLRLFTSYRHAGRSKFYDREGSLLYDTAGGLPDQATSDFIYSDPAPLDAFADIRVMSGVEASQEEAGKMLQTLLLGAFAIDLAALGIGIFLAASFVSRPINTLIQKIQSLQALSDPGARLPVDGPQEVAELASAFNHAAERQQKLTDQLEAALEAEKELNGLHRQFVSLVSHEFRTPLAIIDGTAQRLMKRAGDLPLERMIEGLGTCRRAVTRLIRLMESVLASSRLDAGTIKIDKKPCQIRDLLEEICRNQTEVSASHEAVMHLDGLTETILADDTLLHQIFSNFISNAIKYSPNSNQIWITGKTEEEFVIVSIRDNGLGMTEDDLEKLFSRFFRASTSNGIPGTGIGLHLAKHLVEMHGGRVDVDSVLGKGSTFTVQLPIALADDEFVAAHAA